MAEAYAVAVALPMASAAAEARVYASLEPPRWQARLKADATALDTAS